MAKVRLKFYKTGSVKFIGHLDVMRYFQKAIRRSGLPVAYSQGYSPHQLISFAAPLGVGNTSDAEYLDVQLTKEVEPDYIKDAVNKTMADEMQIVNVTRQTDESKTSMSLLAAADYLVSVKDGYSVPEDFKNRFASFLNQETIVITKKTKKSEQEIDLSQYIYAYAFDDDAFALKTGHASSNSMAEVYENGCKIYLRLACGSVNNLKPDLVIEEFLKWNQEAYNPYAYQYHRLEMYTDENAKKGEIHLNRESSKRKLIPLDQLGV